jgi:glycosyltransferase involved in cell wall biosynthesis
MQPYGTEADSDEDSCWLSSACRRPGPGRSDHKPIAGVASVNRVGSAPGAHIAIVAHDFSAGGTERVAIRLAGAWAAAGRRVTIFCGAAEGPLRVQVPEAVQVVEMQPPIRRSVCSRLHFGTRAAAAIDAAGADILFIPGNFHLPVLRAMRGRFQQRPKTIVKISNPLPVLHGQMPDAIGRLAVDLVIDDVDVFVAMSPSLAAQAGKILRRARIVVIGGPSPDGRIVAPQPQRPGMAPLLVAAGRFVPQKDFELAVRTIAALDPAVPARLVLLGDGQQRPRIERLIRQSGLADRIECVGFIADIRPWLDQARLFLLTSRYEGYPAVVAEALAQGVPVVATDCSPALGELIVDEACGEIVAGRSPALLAAAVERQLAKPRPSRQRLARQVRDNHLDSAAAAYLRLFDAMFRDGARADPVPAEAASA